MTKEIQNRDTTAYTHALMNAVAAGTNSRDPEDGRNPMERDRDPVPDRTFTNAALDSVVKSTERKDTAPNLNIKRP